MSVLVVLFLTAVLALFSGVYNQGKFARYIGILGLLAEAQFTIQGLS